MFDAATPCDLEQAFVQFACAAVALLALLVVGGVFVDAMLVRRTRRS